MMKGVPPAGQADYLWQAAPGLFQHGFYPVESTLRIPVIECLSTRSPFSKTQGNEPS